MDLFQLFQYTIRIGFGLDHPATLIESLNAQKLASVRDTCALKRPKYMSRRFAMKTDARMMFANIAFGSPIAQKLANLTDICAPCRSQVCIRYRANSDPS